MAKAQHKIKNSTRSWLKDVVEDDDIVVAFDQVGPGALNVELSTGDRKKKVRFSLEDHEGKHKVLLALEIRRRGLKVVNKVVHIPEEVSQPQGWKETIKPFMDLLDDIGIDNERKILSKIMVLRR